MSGHFCKYSYGNQEAAVKRLSRLLHIDRLRPTRLATWICRQVLRKIPSSGKVRLAIDWTTEDTQHLLVISLIIGYRAIPIYWHAYDQSVLKQPTVMFLNILSLCCST